MPRLREAISVERSREQIQDALERFFANLRGRDGISRVRLRVSVHRQTIAPHLDIDREVSVKVGEGHDWSNLQDVRVISWAPEGLLIFRSFEGMLAVRCANGTSSIELDGWYGQPLGANGHRYDPMLGYEIAQESAGEFLRDLRLAIEAI